ncbi:hypothetical protein EJB05_02034, partial [Eragrostis curvula]
MARLSGAAVLLLVVVPLCMYTCALFVGIQLGQALERRPDSISIRGVVDYFSKVIDRSSGELWDVERRGRDLVDHGRVLEFAQPVPRSRRVGRPTQPKRTYIRPVVDQESSATKGLQSIEGRSGNLGGDGGLFFVPSSRRDGSVETKYIQYNQRPVVDLESSATKIRSHTRNDTAPRGVISVGPWGGSGGQPFYMHGRGRSPPQVLSIVLYHSAGAIHSLACEYSAAGDEWVQWIRAGPWGLPHSFGSRAVRAVINLSAGEHLTAMEGSVGRFGNVRDVVITSLTFRSSIGRTYGPFGGDKEGSSGSTRFSIPVAAGGCIAGFWGRSGWLLDAVGVYISPCPSPSGAQRQGW